MQKITNFIKKYNLKKHGSSGHSKHWYYVVGEEDNFAPLEVFLKNEDLCLNDIINQGYAHSAIEVFPNNKFDKWYRYQYSKEITPALRKKIALYYIPNQVEIFNAVEKISECYQVFRDHNVLINRKKLPVQLGEWYAKVIFGLEQNKSTSQRGFDFYLDKKRIEVQVSWGDKSNIKGIKFRKSLVEMSEYCILVFLSNNLMVRDICFLDSEFVLRKYGTKGHFIFLKESEIKQYNFSQSNKQQDKVKNIPAMLRFAGPVFAMRASEIFKG